MDTQASGVFAETCQSCYGFRCAGPAGTVRL